MADIKIERGIDCARTFTIKDASGQAINLGESTVKIRWVPVDNGSEAPIERDAQVTEASSGAVAFTFLAAETWRTNTEYLVKFVVTPPPNGTNGRFPDGYALTLQASKQV